MKMRPRTLKASLTIWNCSSPLLVLQVGVSHLIYIKILTWFWKGLALVAIELP